MKLIEHETGETEFFMMYLESRQIEISNNPYSDNLSVIWIGASNTNIQTRIKWFRVDTDCWAFVKTESVEQFEAEPMFPYDSEDCADFDELIKESSQINW